jgi:pyridoxal phosphate enzyme (YggS family)
MASNLVSTLQSNLNRVRERIDTACARAGRTPDEVTLVAVTKYAELDWVRALVDLGVLDLGESRPQQLVSRAQDLPKEVRWHMIGHLQRNKVDLLLPVANRLHSVDSVRLLQAIDKEAKKQQSNITATPRVLLEVNVSGEKSKDGFDPAELQSAWPEICQLDSIAIEGLMTMAPLSEDDDSARAVFRSLRLLRDQLVDACGGHLKLPDLSMGMSGDFEIGIEEGATLVRVGSSLFEGLPSNH